MKDKIIILCYCLLSLGATDLYAQCGTVASGGQATGAGGTVSYSIGQVDYITATGSGGTITQGLQQPYEILVIAGIQETGINLSVFVYPNPTTDFVMLKFEGNKLENFTYQLYDLQGKTLINKKVEGSQTAISVVDFANSTYFIRVLNNNKEVKKFKIIKN